MTNQLRSPLRSSLRSQFEHRRGGAFNPASLASSAFYDRTNLSTLFQDAKGGEAITAVSQPIGRGLDLSQGLSLGPNLVTNGDFSSGSYWTLQTGIIISGGSLVFSSAASGKYAYQTVNGIDGLTFSEITITVTSITAGALSIQLDGSIGDGVNITTPGVYTYRYGKHLTYNNNLYIVAVGTTDAVVEDISLKLVTGNHQVQTSASMRPITAGSPIYSDFDGVDDELVTTFPASLGAGCTVCRSLPSTGASITTGVTIGTTYTDSVDAHALLIFTAAQWAALSAGDISKLTAWLNKKAGL